MSFFPQINSNNFEFTEVTVEDVRKDVLELNTINSLTSGSIPGLIFDICSKFGYI